MAGISSILAELDRLKRMGMNRGRDMVTNTGDYFSQLTDNMRNMQMGREAVASDAGLGYRDLTEEEKLARMTEGAMDSFGGGLGTIGKAVGKKVVPKVLPEGATLEARIKSLGKKVDKAGNLTRGKWMEKIFPEGDRDIVDSILHDEKFKGKGGINIENLREAETNRAKYRAEPNVTPGPTASQKEWEDWAKGYGVDFRLNEPVSLGVSDVAAKREAMIPGGLEGRFTLPDMFWLKGNNFDPNILPIETRRAIQQKFNRTHQPDPNVPMNDVGVFNALQFSQLSPNQPLTQNEFIAQRMRATSADDLRELAARQGEKGLDRTRSTEYGVQAGSRGGMGVRGTPDVGAPAYLAGQLLHKPEMFRAGEGETIKDVVMRLMNQTPSLSQKTAGLGVPMTDLARGNSAAVDLHMIRNNLGELLSSGQGDEFMARANKLLGTEYDKATLLNRVQHEIDNPNIPQDTFKKIRGLIETTQGSVYRDAKGELGRIPQEYPAISPDKLIFEPKQAQELGPFYKQMLENVDAGRGENPTLALFPEQWMRWDGYRGRLEPHEFLHPDYQNLPKQSFNEMQAALQAHKDAGYTYKDKSGTNPVMAQTDWRKLYYGNANPQLLGGMALGGGGLMAYDQMQDDESETPMARMTRYLRERQAASQ